MPNYRRVRIAGACYFFTLVTARRQPTLTTDLARKCLRHALERTRRRWPLVIDAFVLLPDHLHMIWSLPHDDTAYSRRMGYMKKEFTKQWLASDGGELLVSSGYQRHRRRGVWQPKFWEHTMLDEDDFIQHVEYIHYNPVKHELVRCPHQWPYSSFHRYVKSGVYAPDWACACNGRTPEAPHFDRVRDDTIG